MSVLPTCRNSPNATSLQVLPAGRTPCDGLEFPTTEPCGRAPVLASLSARQAKGMGLLTSGTYGRRGSTSSSSAALQSSLESRLLASLPVSGSTLYSMTWKEQVTPAGRRIFLLAASAHRTSGNDSTGWVSPTVQDAHRGVKPPRPWDKGIPLSQQVSGLTGWSTPTTRDWKDGSSDGTVPINGLLGRQVWQASGATPNGSPAETASGGRLNPEFSRWLMGLPPEWCACAPTATQSSRRSPKHSSVRQDFDMSLKPNQTIHAYHPSTRFNVGDYVDVQGQKYRVEALWLNARCSPSGVRLSLDPAVPGLGRWVEGTWATRWQDDGLDFPEPDDGLSAGP